MNIRPALRLIFATMAASIVALAPLSAASASPTGARAAIPRLVVGLPFAVNTLNGTVANIGPLLANFGLESLTTLGSNGQVVPWLAQSITHPRPTVYVYNLRRGVKFWDGTELTSADVVSSLNYQRKPGSNIGYSYGNVQS